MNQKSQKTKGLGSYKVECLDVAAVSKHSKKGNHRSKPWKERNKKKEISLMIHEFQTAQSENSSQHHSLCLFAYQDSPFILMAIIICWEGKT